MVDSLTCEPHSTTSGCDRDQFGQQWALCEIISFVPLTALNPFLLSVSCIAILPVNAAISEDERIIHPLCRSYVFLPSTYMFSPNLVIAWELATETDGGCHTSIQMMKK